jgi:hypothetical protein
MKTSGGKIKVWKGKVTNDSLALMLDGAFHYIDHGKSSSCVMSHEDAVAWLFQNNYHEDANHHHSRPHQLPPHKAAEHQVMSNDNL